MRLTVRLELLGPLQWLLSLLSSTLPYVLQLGKAFYVFVHCLLRGEICVSLLAPSVCGAEQPQDIMLDE